MDTKEFMKRVEELEKIENKYNILKEFTTVEVKNIQQKLKEIEESLQRINPILDLLVSSTKHKGSRNIKCLELYDYLKNNDGSEINLEYISNKYNICSSNAQNISILLRKMNGIQTRLEGKTLFIYYFKPTSENGQTEISPEVKIPTKFSFKA